jgi:hypothetical protein
MNWQPGQQPIMGGHRIEQRLADLERQLAELKKAIQISPAEIVIKSQGAVRIEAQAEARIKAATAKIDAALLILPGGSKPIARLGDVVTGIPPAANITGPGNPQVLG